MQPAQFRALMDAVHALADECALAFMEGRVEDSDALVLADMVLAALTFLRPRDGLEPPSRTYRRGNAGPLSKVPPAEFLHALRAAGFSDQRVATILGCTAQNVRLKRGLREGPYQKPTETPWR